MPQSICACGKQFSFIFLLLVSSAGFAQERTVDPTWLHRYVPDLKEARVDFASATCHYKPMFGEGDPDSRILRSVVRFGEVAVDAHGKCESASYDRQEELYFVLGGGATLDYEQSTFPMRANDFTYVAPRAKHSLSNSGNEPLRLVVMTFRIPGKVAISAPPAQPKIVNMDQLKEETVSGHPTSVLYKLMAGPRTGKRDAIDEAYVVTSLFWMDFAPGGTNFPHHHETAEEIYLVVDGEGDMVAGGGMDGIEGRHRAKAGDAYYFRSNCTVGFYNDNKPGAKSHILAIRSKIPLPQEED
ncbi:MAG TPA: cupin domain-containing protein [Candidatus Sulfotelmatobacter sp.]|nr:cupin domain-containing protein [Candidatus Sulfotelmatobacter sp.]